MFRQHPRLAAARRPRADRVRRPGGGADPLVVAGMQPAGAHPRPRQPAPVAGRHDATQPATLRDAASRAARALHPDLSALDPVAVAAARADRPGAIVVPLSSGAEGGPPAVVGPVAFLRDCLGRAVYAGTDDVLRDQAAAVRLPVAFPAVSQRVAAARLADAAPRLEYELSPFTPVWRARSGRLLSAFP